MVRREEGRRAKVAGTHVMAHGKFRPSGISEKRSRSTPEMPDGQNLASVLK